jgi:tetratricopeptide (TPR) repeat protein
MNISCAASLQGAAQILSGVYQWNRKNYVKAESLFISAAEHAQNSGEQDKTLSYYALYGLAVTYLAQGNAAQAADCFAAITEEAPVALRFASFYNAGILASSVGEYEKAADFFKRALTVDSNNVDAKINLEISRSLQTAASRGAEQELIPASTPKEDPSVTEQAIFSVLREMDTNQWKNSQTEQDSNAAVVDY